MNCIRPTYKTGGFQNKKCTLNKGPDREKTVKYAGVKRWLNSEAGSREPQRSVMKRIHL